LHSTPADQIVQFGTHPEDYSDIKSYDTIDFIAIVSGFHKPQLTPALLIHPFNILFVPIMQSFSIEFGGWRQEILLHN
jgi:hypothetical protein